MKAISPQLRQHEHATVLQLRQREHAKESVLQTEVDMIKAIREAGRTPVQRNTFYEPIKVLTDAGSANAAEPPTGKSKVLEDNLATA